MAVLARSGTEHFGLRPMEPMKDLAGVADLIEEAFADDLDRSGQSALRELRWLSRLKPVLWWMVTFSPDYSDFLSGFVWEENGKIVGNITVNRTSSVSRRWLISNLAVAKNYRGRGIARGLMYAALELVEEYHGSSVSLQVRADNEPARHIYKSLRFEVISGVAHLELKRVPKVEVLPLPRGVVLRPRNFNWQDDRHAYELASAATPASKQKEWPLRQSRFHLGTGERLKRSFCQIISGGLSAYWVVEDGHHFVAMVNIEPNILGQNHQVEMVVHPNWRGTLEKSLISQVLHQLYRWRKRTVVIKQSIDHVEAIETYKEFGFREEQTLLWMKRKM